MCGGAHLLRQAGQHGRTAHILEGPLLAEPVAHGHEIHGDMLVHEAGHGLEYHPVPRIVEAGRGKLLHCEIDALGLEQHRPEHRLLDIGGLGRLVAELLSERLEIHRIAFLARCTLPLRRHYISGLTIILPQCSQITSFLPDVMSIIR